MVIQRIVTLLKEKELKKSDLCKYLGINNSTMANWQSRNTDPPSKYIIPICEFLDVSPYYLLTGEDSNKIITSFLLVIKKCWSCCTNYQKMYNRNIKQKSEDMLKPLIKKYQKNHWLRMQYPNFL